MTNSGVAGGVADFLVTVGQGLGIGGECVPERRERERERGCVLCRDALALYVAHTMHLLLSMFAVVASCGHTHPPTHQHKYIHTDAGLYGAVYFATFLISNVVTNNAAAALLFPIAMDAAEQTGADRLLMSYTLMLGASASFMSPFGYTVSLVSHDPSPSL